MTTTTLVEKLEGRPLDAAVAEEVCGLHVIALDWPCGHDSECGYYQAAFTREDGAGFPTEYEGTGPVYDDHGRPLPVPFYSTSLDACAAVIDHLHQTGWAVLAYRPPACHSKDPNDPVCWSVSLGVAGEDGMRMPMIRRSLAEAVCVAALAAVRGGKEQAGE